MYIDKLDDLVNKFNNTYYRNIKMVSVDVKPSTCIDFNAEKKEKDFKFKVSDLVRITKYKKILATFYTPNWFGEVCPIN